jgi:hypothetical protein
MSRFIPAAVLGSALLGLVTLGFQLERVSAQAKSESAQHQAIAIEQINRWETEEPSLHAFAERWAVGPIDSCGSAVIQFGHLHAQAA